MDEMENGLRFSLRGVLAAQEVARAREQIRAWGLVMPNVEPLVLDFGLGDFRRTGEIEFWIANEKEAGYCGKFLFVFEHQTCPVHHHRQKLETFLILAGKVAMRYGGRTREMKPGDVLRVDRGNPHGFTGLEPSLLLEVSTPSIFEDNYFEDRLLYGDQEGDSLASERAR